MGEAKRKALAGSRQVIPSIHSAAEFTWSGTPQRRLHRWGSCRSSLSFSTSAAYSMPGWQAARFRTKATMDRTSARCLRRSYCRF